MPYLGMTSIIFKETFRHRTFYVSNQFNNVFSSLKNQMRFVIKIVYMVGTRTCNQIIKLKERMMCGSLSPRYDCQQLLKIIQTLD